MSEPATNAGMKHARRCGPAPAMNCPPRSPRWCTVIRESGLPNRTTSMFTEMEGRLGRGRAVVRDASLVLANKGVRNRSRAQANLDLDLPTP